MSPAALPWALGSVALAYALVGHGGASGYLAVGGLAGLPLAALKAQALILNLGVAGLAAWQFTRARHQRWDLLLPLALGSIPAAYVAAGWRTGQALAEGLLAVALAFAALRLALGAWLSRRAGAGPQRPGWLWLVVLGVGLGWLAGLTGVGGGIYLSPWLLWRGWASVKETAACSAAFIVLNSAAGLAGLLRAGPLPPLPPAWLGASLLGGAVGAWLGAGRLPAPALARALAGVLLLAAGKLLWRALA